MFDKTIHKHETVVTPITQVVEKTISPDKVVEMYDKTEEEVRKTLIRKIVIQDNSFNGSITLWKNPNAMAQEIIVAFTLNGKEHRGRDQFSYNVDITNQDFLDSACRAIQNAIMKELFDKLASQLS